MRKNPYSERSGHIGKEEVPEDDEPLKSERL
jgi:hypothetical protein